MPRKAPFEEENPLFGKKFNLHEPDSEDDEVSFNLETKTDVNCSIIKQTERENE
jgi:hypothetical protein